MLTLLGTGCQVPPLEQVAGDKSCDEDAGHACAPGYLCCRGTCTPSNQGCCQPEDDATFCARLGKTCDPVSADDNCGAPRTVTCGTCTDPAVCGGGGVLNVCGVLGCTTETNAAFCTRLGKACGPVTADDSCGVPRTISCGTCTSGVCFQNQCCADSDSAFCARAGKVCGSFTGTDACGQTRTANCGNCPSPESCKPDNTCTCTGETDSAFCTRLGKQCGLYTGPDHCGVIRTANCGVCTTPPNTTCQSNTCACTPDTDAQLCARLGVQCGTATGPDVCGTVRTVACPMCTAPNACGGSGTAGQCGCIAVGSTGCSAAGTACCDGACGGSNPSRCCRAFGDTCTGIAGECCQGICDVGGSGTCCKVSGFCSDNAQCCSGNCDTGGTDQCFNP
ncbi:MAG TPA: hypothetical protein VIG99_14740 [Myxococcaceae bacterium]